MTKINGASHRRGSSRSSAPGASAPRSGPGGAAGSSREGAVGLDHVAPADGYSTSTSPRSPAPGSFAGLSGAIAQRRARDRVQRALQATRSPSDDHRMMRYTRGVRERLAAEGLPTDARGVRIAVLNESLPEHPGVGHGAQIARTISGPAGLAPGADVALLDPVKLRDSGRASAVEGAFDGGTTVAQAARVAESHHARAYQRLTLGLEEVMRQTPPDGPTTVVSVSNGFSPQDVVRKIAAGAIRRGDEGPMMRDLNARRVAAGKSPLSAARIPDRAEIQEEIASEVMAEMNTPQAQARLRSARSIAEAQVRRARDAGILTMVAAGNAHQDGVSGDRTTNVVSQIPGVLAVGAYRVGDPTTTDDDRMAGFSSPRADVVAPGTEMPVGHFNGRAPAVDSTVTVQRADKGTNASRVRRQMKVDNLVEAVGVEVAEPILQRRFGDRRPTELRRFLDDGRFRRAMIQHDLQRAVGLETRIRNRGPRDVEGTSFATPYTAAVAALMIEANPEISPDQIEAILTSDQVGRDLPGSKRDGHGAIDEVAAVRMARDLRG